MFSTSSLEKLLAGHEHVTCPGSWGQSRELVIPDCKAVNPVCTSWGPDPLSILFQSSFSPLFLLTSLSHWSLNPCAQQVVYCLSKHLLLLSNIPFQPSLEVRLLLPFLSINQPRTELHRSPFSLTSAYFSPVALPQSTVFENNLVAPIFCNSNKHESPTELCWETFEFTTGLKITPFQKHQLLHNWKLKLWTSCGLFYLQSEIACFRRLLSAHSSARTEKKKKKKIIQCYKLKICRKGKNNKSETFASKSISCNSNSSRIYKTESCQVSVQISPYISCFSPPPPNLPQIPTTHGSRLGSADEHGEHESPSSRASSFPELTKRVNYSFRLLMGPLHIKDKLPLDWNVTRSHW